MQFGRAYYSERKMLSPVKQRVVRRPVSVKSRMPKGAKERTALIRYTAQGSVTISVSRKQNRLPDEELSALSRTLCVLCMLWRQNDRTLIHAESRLKFPIRCVIIISAYFGGR